MNGREFMARAIDLSRNGTPTPGAHVGCVLVRDAEIVGEGFFKFPGQPHAEVMALSQAGERARGATAYVTLEPCNHEGRTGPCSLALLDAGIAKVVYAVDDPNPRAQGGAQRLRDAGVVVEAGLLAEEAAEANERFLTAMRLRRPFVTVKAAASLDGRIALPSGESRWITGEEARRAAHALRQEMGAVLIGPGTALADNPSLTVRYGNVDPSAVKPTRVILDPRGELPTSLAVFDSAAPTLHVVPPGFASHAERLELPLEGGHFSIASLLEALFDQKLTGLLVEGGGSVIGSFFAEGFVDAVELFMAPRVLGAGPTWVEGFVSPGLDMTRFRLKSSARLGDDIWLSLRPLLPSLQNRED